jgi:hypothetical protein
MMALDVAFFVGLEEIGGDDLAGAGDFARGFALAVDDFLGKSFDGCFLATGLATGFFAGAAFALGAGFFATGFFAGAAFLAGRGLPFALGFGAGFFAAGFDDFAAGFFTGFLVAITCCPTLGCAKSRAS